MTPDTTLRTEGLCKQWGAFKANSDISLSFAAGARHAAPASDAAMPRLYAARRLRRSPRIACSAGQKPASECARSRALRGLQSGGDAA